MSENRSRVLLALFVAAAVVSATLAVPADLAAQDEAPLLRPGDARLDLELLRPFRAEYEQAGTPFWFELRQVEGDRPVLAAVMTMHSFLGGLAVDHAGLYADDLSFAYRQTQFGRWGHEYINAERTGDEIRMARMSLEAEGSNERRWITGALGAPFEGTLLYWLLPALPLGTDYRVRLPTLAWTEDGFEERIDEYRVRGRETVSIGGHDFDCWIVAVSNAEIELRSYVTAEAPYLVRQTVFDGTAASTIIDLRRVDR